MLEFLEGSGGESLRLSERNDPGSFQLAFQPAGHLCRPLAQLCARRVAGQIRSRSWSATAKTLRRLPRDLWDLVVRELVDLPVMRRADQRALIRQVYPVVLAAPVHMSWADFGPVAGCVSERELCELLFRERGGEPPEQDAVKTPDSWEDLESDDDEEEGRRGMDTPESLGYRSVRLAGCAVSLSTIHRLVDGTRGCLVHLDLSGVQTSSLRTLDLDAPALLALDVSGTRFERFRLNLPRLRCLAYRRCVVGRQIAAFRTCRRVRALDLSWATDIDELALSDCLRQFPRLRWLNLSRASVADNVLMSESMLSTFNQHVQLTDLLLCGVDLSCAAAIRLISRLLFRVDFRGCPVLRDNYDLLMTAKELLRPGRSRRGNTDWEAVQVAQLAERAKRADFEWRTRTRWMANGIIGS